MVGGRSMTVPRSEGREENPMARRLRAMAAAVSWLARSETLPAPSEEAALASRKPRAGLASLVRWLVVPERLPISTSAPGSTRARGVPWGWVFTRERLPDHPADSSEARRSTGA